MQAATVLWIDHDAPPGGQNQITASRQIVDGLRLTTPESIFPLDFKNGRDGNPSPFDDLVVRIEKLPRQPFGQHAPNGRFPRPHQADQINISILFHGRILADSRRQTKKAGISRPSIGVNKLSVNAHLVGNDSRRNENEKLPALTLV